MIHVTYLFMWLCNNNNNKKDDNDNKDDNNDNNELFLVFIEHCL